MTESTTTRVPVAIALLNRVPEVTLFFWVIKILATTVGETAADFLNTTLGLGLTGTSLVMATLLAVALGIQFRARRYVPAVYWTVVVLVSVVGTLVTDNLTDNLGVSLVSTTTVFFVGLMADGNPLRFHWTMNAILCLLYLAVVGSSFTFLLLYWLMPRMSVTNLQTISLITPPGAIALGWAFGGVQLSAWSLVGAAFVLLGVWMIFRRIAEAKEVVAETAASRG